MPVLDNPKHEAFAQARAEGLSQDDAYVQAGFKANRGNAARLNANDSVASRVKELQALSAEEAVVSAATLSDQLEDIRVKAIAANQMGAAAQAVMGRAKLHGLIIDKAEIKDTTLPPEMRRQRILELSAKFAVSR